MEKTLVHQNRNFTVGLHELDEALEITSPASGVTGYVGPAPEPARRDPDRIFTFTVNPDKPPSAAAMTLDEALHECCDAILEKEAQMELTDKAVNEMKEWLNR